MPSGYLVSLGDGILNPSDPITGPLTDFTTADILGNGSWTWSGTWTGNGTNYSNITDTGIYYLGTDGNTYFIPTNWFVDPITTASVTTDPSIDGTAGNDVINDSYTDPDGKTLDATDNVIHTGAGNDTIITNGAVNGSADTVFAGSGNDTVITGRGDDVVYGEAGDDTIEGGSGADRLDGGDGVDTISGGSGNDTILGGADNDILSGNGGSDIVDGGTGDDVIDGGAGNDTLRGDEGADTITGGVGEDEIYGGEGGDTIYGDETAAGVVSTKMSWAQEGINGQDITSGFTQDADGINITVGAVDLGGLNRAEISTDPQYVGSGPFATNSALQFGGAGNGGSGIINGGAGNDQLDGGNDDDTINGGIGQDTLIGGAGADTLDGGADNDTIFGGVGNDTLTGGDGADQMFGGDDADTFFGGIGDTIVGGEGGSDNDTLDVTGAGPTRVYYDVGNPENGTIEFLDGTGAVTGTLTFSEIENVNFVPCFTAGTMITTARGEIAMQDLKVGDMVLTRDSGFQAIRWIGSTAVKAVENFAPIRFAKGALGNNEEMLVSPQHRVLLSGWKAEMLFGEAEVLASARSLVNGRNITVVEGGEVEYFHMMFDRHEIVLSDKAWTESFHPGDVALDGMAEAARDEIFTLFPELKSDKSAYGSTARQVVKPHVVAALVDGSNALCQV